MKGAVWIIALVVAAVQVQAHGYVLLTANVEDLQAIAQRIVDSPMAEKVHSILRRASSVFTQHMNRADDNDRPSMSTYLRAERRSDTNSNDAVTVADDSQPLGKNASVFLKSIRKIFENV